MKKILRRSTLIYIVALAFIGGLGYLAFELVTGADDWVDQAYNAHIAGDGGLAQAGAIYDRNGTALAQTVDGKRVYNESESVRKSLLHVVGDDSLNISTAVQSMYRSQLIGYNLVFGLTLIMCFRQPLLRVQSSKSLHLRRQSRIFPTFMTALGFVTEVRT